MTDLTSKHPLLTAHQTPFHPTRPYQALSIFTPLYEILSTSSLGHLQILFSLLQLLSSQHNIFTNFPSGFNLLILNLGAFFLSFFFLSDIISSSEIVEF